MAITYADHLIDIGANEMTVEQEREIEAREECARLGLDPDDYAADGALVWMVVDQEKRQRIRCERCGDTGLIEVDFGQERCACRNNDAVATLAHRFWSIHPSSIAATNLTREEYYAREMTRLLTSETKRLIVLNNKLTEDFNTLALDRSQWQDRAEKLSVALAAERAINKDLKIELDDARTDVEKSLSDFKEAGGKLREAQDAISELRANLADQRVISNYNREQAIIALATLKLARPYVARIASRTSGPDVRDHLSKIDALIGK